MCFGYHDRVRPSSLLAALLLIACTEADHDKPAKNAAEPDKAPTAAEPELDTDGLVEKHGDVVNKTEVERAQCVATCVEANVAEAKPADVIEADCRSKCDPPTPVGVRPQ